MRSLPLLALLVAACDSLPPPPSTPGSARRVGPGRLPDASVRPDLAPPALVEVEIDGRAAPPAGAPEGRVLVLVTDGPCFQPGTHYLGSATAQPGRPYFVEVFPPWGTNLEVCAALLPAGRRATSLWGRAARGPLLAQGRGEVEFHGVDVVIGRAREITIPDGIKLPP